MVVSDGATLAAMVVEVVHGMVATIEMGEDDPCEDDRRKYPPTVVPLPTLTTPTGIPPVGTDIGEAVPVAILTTSGELHEFDMLY
jgi:hypothetical protein